MDKRFVVVPVRRAGRLFAILTWVAALVVISLAPVALAETEAPVVIVLDNNPAGDAQGAAGPETTQTLSCPGNILQNPSFETASGANSINDKIPSSWFLSGGGELGVTTAFSPPDGIYVGYVWTRPSGTPAIMYQQASAVPGAPYRFTFYSGTHNPAANPTIAVRFYNSSGVEVGTPAIHTITTDIDNAPNKLGGPYTLNATAPLNAVNLRVLFTDSSSSGSGGGAKGDSLCLQQIAQDYGDLPDGPYPTLLANNGPRHVIVSGVQLGAAVDAEANGQPNAVASGDDTAGATPDDEDGVAFLTPLTAGKAAKIQVTASVAGCLNAWVDYNGNGVLTDSGEQIATNQPVAAGANILNVTAPTSARGVLYSRFRFTAQCGQGGQTPTGPATSGEVEDYVLAALGDYVWVDTNVDGIQNDGNTGLNGVTVKLLSGSGSAVLDANGNPITTLTANNPVGGQPGWYEFAGLPAGSYIAQFVAPDGYSFTAAFQGGSPALDSNANATAGPTYGQSGVVALAAGQNNPTIDAGLKSGSPTAVSLAGFSARGGNVPWGGFALLGSALVGLVFSQWRRRC